jgi:hypothetical protein
LDNKTQKSVRDGENTILLPKQLWCSFEQNKDGETLSEVGWVLDHGKAITSSCLFSSTAKLKASYIYDTPICIQIYVLSGSNLMAYFVLTI